MFLILSQSFESWVCVYCSLLGVRGRVSVVGGGVVGGGFVHPLHRRVGAGFVVPGPVVDECWFGSKKTWSLTIVGNNDKGVCFDWTLRATYATNSYLYAKYAVSWHFSSTTYCMH